LKTQQIAKTDPTIKQDPDYKEFSQKFAPIQNEIPFVAKNNIEFPSDPSEVPAEDLQNLTTEQSAQIIESNKDLKSEV